MDHIAVCRLDRPPDSVMTTPLSREEQISVEQARTRKRRREIAVSRHLMRYCLMQFASAADAPVEWTGTGPRYQDAGNGFGLSLSHSRHHAAVAVAANRPIGIDVESIETPRRWERIMNAVFCSQDVHWVSQNPRASFESSSLQRFLAIWTAREAYAKYHCGSILDHISRPILRESSTAGADSITPGNLRIEVSIGVHRVIAVCRQALQTMPVCRISDHEAQGGFLPYTADFAFIVPASHEV